MELVFGQTYSVQLAYGLGESKVTVQAVLGNLYVEDGLLHLVFDTTLDTSFVLSANDILNIEPVA